MSNAELILNTINESFDHLTAEEIFMKLKKSGTKISFATVYNNLNKLVQDKLIVKLVFEDQPDRYDRIDRHDHLICEKCGHIKDVVVPDLTKTIKDAIGEDIDSYSLTIKYVCSECKKRGA